MEFEFEVDGEGAWEMKKKKKVGGMVSCVDEENKTKKAKLKLPQLKTAFSRPGDPQKPPH